MLAGILEGLRAFKNNIMHVVSQCIDLFTAIPGIIWIIAGLGLVLCAGLIFFIYYLMTRERTPKTETEEKVENIYKLPPIGGWFSEFLCRKGFFKIGRLSVDFLNSLNFLEETLKSSDYKYRNPWFLVIGATNSGKTTLMKSMHTSDLSLAGQGDMHRNTECNWHFLRGCVGVDLQGKLFCDGGAGADDIGWNALKNLLLRYRSSKPIDSLVLTISVEELYGKGRLSTEMCLERAKFVAHKLLAFQDQIKMRIPLYVVITKTDLIPGFKEFCQFIPRTSRQDMLGWSSPYNKDTTFSADWVQEALSAVSEQVSHVGMDISCFNRTGPASDSIYVFPYELEKIQDNLMVYMNQLFSSNQNKTPLLFRGIYFTGDSSVKIEETADDFINEAVLNVEAPAGTTEVPAAQTTEEEEHARYQSIFFFRDLIYSKIVPERNLCSPYHGAITTANRSLQVVKFSTGAFIIISAFGLHSAYQNIKESRNHLIPSIHSMYRFLVLTQQIPTAELAKKNEAFEGAVKQLDTIMQRLDKAQLGSIFIPSSWFSPLRSKLGKAVNLAYQNVIMRALYVNLMLKTRGLLQTDPNSISPSSSLAQLALPTKSNEFIAMNDFVEGLATLAHRVDQFNDLRLVPSASALKELIFYAFGMNLSESFIVHYKDLKGQLNAAVFPAIDLSVYKGHARKTLTALFQHFFNTMFIHSNPTSFPAQLEAVIRQLQGVDSHGLLDIDMLRTLGADMEIVLKTFGEDEKQPTWMDKDAFEPDEQFEKFLCAIDQSHFFGSDISQAMVDNCAIGMVHLKKRLKEITKILTTDVRFAAPESTDDEGPRACSQGIILLGSAIRTLFAEPYMRAPAQRKFIDKEPEGMTLYWDEKLLQAASELCKQYEEFITKNTGTFPVVLQESFRLLAREGLQRNIISLLAQSQNFIGLPSNMHNKLVMEEMIRSKAANMRQVTPYLLKLLELLNYESVSFFYVTLRELLLESNYWVLGKINELMKLVGPYHIWDPSFSWWNGKENPAYAAYGVKDAQDLSSYLTLQGQHTVNLAINLAKPFVDFLTSDIMLTVNPLDKSLLSKWRRIVEQTDAYQKKQPGNSIAMLENFVTTTFKEYTLDNVFEHIKIHDVMQPAGDHFLETMLFIKKGILGRVEVLTRKRNVQRYQELMQVFNQKLRGRFPFTPLATDSLQGMEADPEDLREFLQLFKDYGATADNILNQVYQLGDVARDAYGFLKKCEDVYLLFQPYLESGDGVLPFVSTSWDFNVNREKTVGGNYVAQWSARVNYDELISLSDKDHQTRWVYGAPTEITFRWPNVNTVLDRPLNDPKQPALQALDTTATFTCKGKWSVLRMVRMYQAHKGEFLPMANPNAVVLKFVIPVSETKKAILFNAVSFLGISQNPNLPGRSLALPNFPLFAPSFNPEIAKYMNEPIISFRVIDGGE